ncbi:MAG: hypothetical protein CMH54_09220 [Myxococcales bacterium]|nr:hypothetical protein [Myxococcales bacterium]
MFRKGDFPPVTGVFGSFSGASGLTDTESVDGEHPCQGCVAPCCSTVTVFEMTPRTFRDVDYLGYILGFDRLELMWLPDGSVEVNYRALCRHLERSTGRCKVHDTPEQPDLCRDYDAKSCAYKPQFLGVPRSDSIRVSEARFAAVAALFSYDARGRIVKAPDSDAIRTIMVRSDSSHEKEESAEYGKTRSTVQVPDGSEGLQERSHEEARLSPCEGCSAPCCDVLLFRLPDPVDRAVVDFYSYISGFPGLEIASTPRGWVVQCFSRCRHLNRDQRCDLYGQKERPVHCQTYDAWSCRYVPTFLQGDELYTSIPVDQWAKVVGLFVFDESGQTVDPPDHQSISAQIKNG